MVFQKKSFAIKGYLKPCPSGSYVVRVMLEMVNLINRHCKNDLSEE